MTVGEVREKVERHGARAVARDAVAAIAEKDAKVGAFLEVFDDVQAQADAVDRRLAAGERLPLAGVPIALKDNILVRGKRVSAASRMLEGYVAPYDAHVVRRLKEAGAVLIGRTNCDEFAMGSSTEYSAFGPTKNPHDPSRVPGGSSGGSAAAVAAGMVPLALGSDTGGSIRQPASFCGVVGLKPTYGAVSRYGLIAMGSSLDVIGPFAATVADVALLYRTIAGHDPCDSTSLPPEGHPSRAHHERTHPLRIGVPRDLLGEGMDSRVAQVFEEALAALARRGHEVVDIALPAARHALAVYYIIMPAEASTNLARYDGVRYGLHVEGADLWEDYLRTRQEGFGPEVKRRILLGTYVLSAGYYDAYYRKAQKVRRAIRREFAAAFATVDVIATPTAPTPPFRLGEKRDPLSMYLADVFTVPANIAGIPALSLPMGSVEEGGASLPLGMQCMAAHRNEEVLFHIGEELEAHHAASR